MHPSQAYRNVLAVGLNDEAAVIKRLFVSLIVAETIMKHEIHPIAGELVYRSGVADDWQGADTEFQILKQKWETQKRGFGQ